MNLFKIGYLVEVFMPLPPLHLEYGNVGIVVHLEGGDVGVDWGKDISGFSLGGMCTPGHGWWHHPDDLRIKEDNNMYEDEVI